MHFPQDFGSPGLLHRAHPGAHRGTCSSAKHLPAATGAPPKNKVLAESCDKEYLGREMLRGQPAERCRRKNAECSRSVCTVIPGRQ